MQRFLAQIILAIILTTLFSHCKPECVDKGITSKKFSLDIQESKANKVFQYRLYSTKDKISVDTNLLISIDTAWVENGWGYKCINNKSKLLVNSSKYPIVQSSIIGNPIRQTYYYLGRHQLDMTKHYLLSESTNLKYYIYRDTIESNPELTYERQMRENPNASPEFLENILLERKSKIVDSVQFTKLNSR